MRRRRLVLLPALPADVLPRAVAEAVTEVLRRAGGRFGTPIRLFVRTYTRMDAPPPLSRGPTARAGSTGGSRQGGTHAAP